jgi:hypothetical protein
MMQTKLPQSVCTKRWCENQVHNYKLVGKGSLEHIMQGGSLKDMRQNKWVLVSLPLVDITCGLLIIAYLRGIILSTLLAPH